jgi:hypothetical protein
MKGFYANQSDIPAGLAEHYEAKDGKFVLKVEGELPGFVTPAAAEELRNEVKQFRSTNIGLQTKASQLEAQLKTFEGIDPAEHRALKDKIAGFESKGTKDPADVDARIAAALKPIADKLEKSEQLRAQADSKLGEKEVETELTRVGITAGVAKTAMADFLARGKATWKHKDGKVVAFNGDTPLFGEKGQPLTLEEWSTGLTTEAPHLFKPSGGGGANPGAGASGAAKVITGVDPLEFGQNLEAIAKGTVAVQRPQ